MAEGLGLGAGVTEDEGWAGPPVHEAKAAAKARMASVRLATAIDEADDEADNSPS